MADLIFTRHARNEMRRRGLSETLVVRVVEDPDSFYDRVDGCTEYLAEVDGRTFEVVVAEGSPRRVVTAYERKGAR